MDRVRNMNLYEKLTSGARGFTNDVLWSRCVT